MIQSKQICPPVVSHYLQAVLFIPFQHSFNIVIFVINLCVINIYMWFSTNLFHCNGSCCVTSRYQFTTPRNSQQRKNLISNIIQTCVAEYNQDELSALTMCQNKKASIYTYENIKTNRRI